MKQTQLKAVLNYNKETGEFKWLKTGSGIKLNRVAGCKDNNGYIIIAHKGKQYKAHRLAFLYETGSMPEFVDHINHDVSDNRMSNLRPAGFVLNGKNRKIGKNNTSGSLGVRKNINKNSMSWSAQVMHEQKPIYLGTYETKEEAIVAREQANKKYNFHKNHGTK